MKRISILAMAITLSFPFFVQGETIDEHISKNQNKPGTLGLWGNGLWVSVPVYDPKNIDKMLQELYNKISYDEGRPKDWTVLENKEADFGYGKYLIVRVRAFGKEHLHFFSATYSKHDKGYSAR